MSDATFDRDSLVIYRAEKDYPEFGIDRGDHVVITALSDANPVRVVKLGDRKKLVRLMSAGLFDQMTPLRGELSAVPFEPAPQPRQSAPLRASRRARTSRQK